MVHRRLPRVLPGQPALTFTALSLDEILSKVRHERFPDLAAGVRARFMLCDGLAFISGNEIGVHIVLNHPRTPIEVLGFVLSHELLHVVVPPQEVEGKVRSHPPAFWEAERRLCPERDDAWRWIRDNLGYVITDDPRREMTKVESMWRWVELTDRTGWLERPGRGFQALRPPRWADITPPIA